MGEDGWRELREPWERLRWARLHCTAFARPTDAARALDLRPGTYRTYELPKADGGRTPRLAELQRIGRRFGVSWTWLAAGCGRPQAPPEDAQALAERIAARLSALPAERRRQALSAIEEALACASARRPSPPGR